MGEPTSHQYNPVWVWSDVVRSLNGCFQQYSRSYSQELVVIACDGIACESLVKGTLGGVLVILEPILPQINKNPHFLGDIVQFITNSIDVSHDKDSESIQSLILALGTLLKSSTTKRLQCFIYIRVVDIIQNLLKPEYSLFLNERAQFDLSNFVDDAKTYINDLKLKINQYPELDVFYFGEVDQTLKLTIIGKMNSLNEADSIIAKSSINLILSFHNPESSTFQLESFNSLLDLIITCSTSSSLSIEPITSLLIYLIDKIKSCNHIYHINNGSFVLWKLIEVSRDIWANNEREKVNLVVDSIMDGVLPALIAKGSNIRTSMDQLSIINRLGSSIISADSISENFGKILPDIITTKLSKFHNSDAIVTNTLQYVRFSVLSHSSSAYLSHGFNSIINFVDFWRQEPSIKEEELCDIYNSAMSAAQLLLTQHVQAESMAQFFSGYIPDCMKRVLVWYHELPNKEMANLQNLSTFVLRILDFWYQCTKNGVNRYKVFVLYLPPIFDTVSNISDVGCKENKITLMFEILGILETLMKKGIKVSEFLSDGMPVLLQLSKELKLHCDDVLKLFTTMVDRLESNSGFELLFKLNHSYRFAIEHYTNTKEINLFYLNLIKKGKRQEISTVNELMRSESLTPRYLPAMEYILGLNKKKPLSARDMALAVDIVVNLMKVTKPLVDTPQEEKDVIFPIIDGIVSEMIVAFENGSFSKRSKEILDTISRVTMFRTLFKSDLAILQGKNREEISREFSAKFPGDVVQNTKVMSGLLTLSRRIDNTRPKYDHVIKFGVECAQKFLDNSHPLLAECENDKQKIALRKKILQDFIFEHPKNIEIRDRLISLGYGENLWKNHIAVLVETECRRNLEGNFKVSLQGLYGEYIDILKNLDIKTIEIEGQSITSEKIFEPPTFAEILGIEDLRNRRMAVVKSIDLAISELGKSNSNTNSNFAFRKSYESRKFALLSREDRLENEFNRNKIALENEVPKKQTYRIRLNNTFFTNVQTCDTNIVGCYAPDGDHCEKPIECGFKACSAVISLFVHDDKGENEGVEMENVEVLYTDQGMYMYKLYTNGHPYDTSKIWASFLKDLITEGYIPAIIIPKKFPSPSLYGLVCRYIPEQIVGCILNYKDDFFSEEGVETYYDFKPEKIKAGDVVINDRNVSKLKLDASESSEETTKMKQTVLRSSADLGTLGARFTTPKKVVAVQEKDLSGTIVSEVMGILKTDPDLKKFTAVLSAFGRFISQYINTYIEKGTSDRTILSKNFDVELWNRRHSLPSEMITVPEMEYITDKIQKAVASQLTNYYDVANLQLLLRSKPAHFFEVKSHVEAKLQASVNGPLLEFSGKNMLGVVRAILIRNLKYYKISDFENSQQVEIMKWIFKNEDKVWRDRGGRPGEETLSSFLSLVQPAAQFTNVPIPGFIVINNAQSEELKIGDNIVGYLIGEFVAKKQYEVITTWVDPRYKGLAIAVQLYRDAFLEVWKQGGTKIECDVIAGSVSRIYTSSVVGPIFKFGLGRILITKLENSYTAQAAGGEEQFMKVHLRVWPVVICARMAHFTQILRNLFREYVLRISNELYNL